MRSDVPADAVAVGRIADAYGVQGMVKITPFAEQKTILLDVKKWWLMRTDTQLKPLEPMRSARLISSRSQGDAVVARLQGIHNREQAQALKGTTVYIARVDFPATDDDEFYWVDLIGCTVYSQHTSPPTLIGEVVNVSNNGAHAVLHIHHQTCHEKDECRPTLNAKGKPVEVLIPFVKAIVPDVDIALRRIVADWPHTR